MSAPKKGEMKLYSACIPDMRAGKYTISLKQELSAGTAKSNNVSLPGVVEDVDRYIDVTGPRLSLAGNEIFGSFPPNHAVGAFDNRLAHITLKRRTLPWERKTGDASDNSADLTKRKPWLVLVVLAEAEANFNRNVSVSEFTGSLTAEVRKKLDLDENASMDLLEVTEEVVNKVFPLQDEVSLLSHVREVNLADTELAGSDDDGFMAVLLSNRLPRKGQSYGAYLISLEERLDVLPKTHTGFTDEVGGKSVYERFTAEVMAAASSSFAMNYYSADTTASVEARAVSKVTVETERSAYVATRNPNLTRSVKAAQARTSKASSASAWSPKSPPKGNNKPVATAQATAQPFLYHDINFVALLGSTVKRVKFPVLAHWSFTCSEFGGFETLMQNLDVGLHGKPGQQDLPRDGDLFANKQTPDITDTGHTLVDHLTRQGDKTKSWYRGPLTPRQVVRNLENAPYHMADQARRLVENGREDISEAAAFECGRLLALSDTSFIQALTHWRRSDFYVKRKNQNRKTWDKIQPELVDADHLNPKLTERFFQLKMLEKLVEDKKLFAPPRLRPIHENNTPLTKTDMNTIAAGLGVSIKDVSRTMSLPDYLPETLLEEAEILAEQDFNKVVGNADVEFSHLHTGLKQSLSGIVQNMGLDVDIDKDLDALLDGSLDQYQLDPKNPGGVIIDDHKLPDDLKDVLKDMEDILKDKLEDRIKEIGADIFGSIFGRKR